MNVAALGYLIAAVCVILALRGLSSPATSRQGNRYGMAGLAIAILVVTGPVLWLAVWLLAGSSSGAPERVGHRALDPGGRFEAPPNTGRRSP